MRTLSTTVRGPVHRPRDDEGPALVVEATGASDIQAALAWARDHDLPFAVQATGHGTHLPARGALLLRTTRMAGVLVDPDRRIARAGPGARWSDVIAAAAPFGLAPLSGSSPSVGVAGYTLGGGLGLLSRTFGLAADSLLRADLVTAGGALVSASREREPELFWALRGGGGNFGVVTALEFRLHPVGRVYAGVAHFPAERAVETLARYRDWAASAPDELSTSIVLGTGSTFAVKVLSAGDATRTRRALRPLLREPVTEDLRTTAFADVTLPSVAPVAFNMFDTLPDAMIERLAAMESPIEVKHWGGAIARPATDPGPAGHRDTPFSVSVNGSAAAIAPYATGGSFLNFLHDPARVATAFTPENFRRLRAAKRAYDPDNVFHLNLNIRPGGDSDDNLSSRPA